MIILLLEGLTSPSNGVRGNYLLHQALLKASFKTVCCLCCGEFKYWTNGADGLWSLKSPWRRRATTVVRREFSRPWRGHAGGRTSTRWRGPRRFRAWTLLGWGRCFAGSDYYIWLTCGLRWSRCWRLTGGREFRTCSHAERSPQADPTRTGKRSGRGSAQRITL